MTLTVVTGTDTGVGKTIAVAALAARSATAGRRAIVVKPVQTGVGGDDPDVPDADTVHRLTRVDVECYTALDDPLAPDTAARRQGVEIPRVASYLRFIVAHTTGGDYDDVIVEGAGGVLVRLDSDGGTILDLAAALTAETEVEAVVVTRAGLGTLNHTELTVAALRARGIEPRGLVIGSWPAAPGLAEDCNVQDLPRVTGVPLLAVIPEGAGDLDRDEFLASAGSWFR